MATIDGVLGPIDTADLGFTLMHEHVAVANWNMRQAFGDRWFRPAEEIAGAVEEGRVARALGVRTMVDLTPINLGRDIHVIREFAERSGIQVIAATGFYWTEEPTFQGWDVARLVDFLLPDVTDGIMGTSSKAGIIKCATDAPGVTETNRKLLETAARLHRRTGVPISTHTNVHHHTGPAQQDVFQAEGVDLSRVVIGHCGDTEDADHLEGILGRGSFIGMDRFGLDLMLPLEKRVGVIAELCRRGWEDQMVLSHDACCRLDWFPKEAIRELAPRWRYRHIPEDVIPALRQAGLTDGQVGKMTVTNPRRLFERQGAY